MTEVQRRCHSGWGVLGSEPGAGERLFKAGLWLGSLVYSWDGSGLVKGLT